MGYTNTTTGHLTITPPLNTRETAYLKRLTRSAEGRIRRPGYSLPWEPSQDGSTLAITHEFGTKEPLAEWAAYLASHLLGPNGPDLHGRPLAGFTYDHHLTGEVEVQGMSNGDRWTLLADDNGLGVHRTELPCPSCWVGTLLTVRPSNAYRFRHPVREANVIDGRLPVFDHDRWEEDCLNRSWAPSGRTGRRITWPWDRDFFHSWWIDLAATPDAVPFPEPDDRLPDDRQPDHPSPNDPPPSGGRPPLFAVPPAA